MECKEVLKHPLLGRAFHTLAVVKSKIYLHGGIDRLNSRNDPFDDLIQFDPVSLSVQRIETRNVGPMRSHHAAVAFDDRWICIVGGWNGKQRTTDVQVFDTDQLEWKLLKPTANSVAPAGLSSHSCTKITDNEIIVAGREGGIHMQRRYGSVFKLTVNLHNATYCFTEMPIHISSRSGHTACLLKKQTGKRGSTFKFHLVLFGGRDSDSVDVFGDWDAAGLLSYSDTGGLEEKLKMIVSGNSSNSGDSLCAPTRAKGLRHHSALEAGKFALLHGGEVFGKARDTISPDFFIHNSSASQWWKLQVFMSARESMEKNAGLKRMGHCICFINDAVYIVSGIGSDGKNVIGSVLKLPFA